MRILKFFLILILVALLLPAVPGWCNTSVLEITQITKNDLIYFENGDVYADVEINAPNNNDRLFVAVATYDKSENELLAINAKFREVQNSKLCFNEKLDKYPEGDNMANFIFVWDDNFNPVCQSKPMYFTNLIQNGCIVYEAENITTENVKADKLKYDDFLSGGCGVLLDSIEWNSDKAKEKGPELKAEFCMNNAKEQGRYKLWLRGKIMPDCSESSASIYYDLNSNQISSGWINSSKDGAYYWNSFDIYINSGKNYFSVYSRTPVILDKIIITNNIDFKPIGKDDIPSYISMDELEKNWSTLWEKPEITPPANIHPRLFFTADTKESIQSKITAPNSNVKWIFDGNKSFADQEFSSNLNVEESYNYSEMGLARIIARAFEYAMGCGEDRYAIEAISHMKNYLITLRTPDDANDITRERGNVLLTAAMVYDWCYDKLNDDDKIFFKNEMLKLVASKEIGWPPTNMSDVASHAGEREIFRDLLAAGIALYDEYPLLYNLTMGRLMEDMLPARQYLRNAGRFEQGNDYGEARAFSELWADITLSRMLGKNESVLYKETDYADAMRSLLYNRLPYGAMLSVGDSYSNRYQEYDYYYKDYPLAQHIAGNLYNDPYLKNEFKRIQQIYGSDEFNKFFVMLFENPDVPVKVWDELPLSKVYSYPLSGITARTSWQEGIDSDTALAFMDMHEVFIGDHQHKYTGDFQIYYKGLLALNSGLYGSSTLHDEGYNHRAISANTVLVENPSEEFAPSWGNVAVPNDGGQRNPLSNVECVDSFDELAVDSSGNVTNDNLIVAKDIKKYVGPDINAPTISYISGDLKPAYTQKVSAYTRSMAFIDLDGYTDIDGNPYPAAFMVYDKIKSSNADYKKTWLLHSQDKPSYEGSITTIERKSDGFGGKLVNNTLLPKDINISVVGGENGEMYTSAPFNNSYLPKNSNGSFYVGREGGNYRIEISPLNKNANDTFLNAMFVTDSGNTNMIEMTSYSDFNFDGVEFLDRQVLFNKNDGLIDKGFDFVKSGNKFTFISGLNPGVWHVKCDGVFDKHIEVTPDSCSLYFESEIGTYTITPISGVSPDTLSFSSLSKKPIGDFFVWKGRNSIGSSSARGNFVYLTSQTMLKNKIPYVSVNLLEKLGMNVEADVNENKAIVTKGEVVHAVTDGIVENDTIYIPYTHSVFSSSGYKLTYKPSSNTLYCEPK